MAIPSPQSNNNTDDNAAPSFSPMAATPSSSRRLYNVEDEDANHPSLHETVHDVAHTQVHAVLLVPLTAALVLVVGHTLWQQVSSSLSSDWKHHHTSNNDDNTTLATILLTVAPMVAGVFLITLPSYFVLFKLSYAKRQLYQQYQAKGVTVSALIVQQQDQRMRVRYSIPSSSPPADNHREKNDDGENVVVDTEAPFGGQRVVEKDVWINDMNDQAETMELRVLPDHPDSAIPLTRLQQNTAPCQCHYWRLWAVAHTPVAMMVIASVLFASIRLATILNCILLALALMDVRRLLPAVWAWERRALERDFGVTMDLLWKNDEEGENHETNNNRVELSPLVATTSHQPQDDKDGDIFREAMFQLGGEED